MSDRDQISLRLDYSGPLMTEDEAAVWDVLRMCKGRSLAILGPEIEELTGIPYKRVQKIINDLRCHHARLIGSGTCGYYLPQTREELDDVEHYIKDRAIKALCTWGNLRRMSVEEILQQLRLELKPALSKVEGAG